jgi:hypothetical protein
MEKFFLFFFVPFTQHSHLKVALIPFFGRDENRLPKIKRKGKMFQGEEGEGGCKIQGMIINTHAYDTTPKKIHFGIHIRQMK